jgi:hypothetical protein
VYRRNRRGLPAGACFDRTLQVIRLSGCTWVYSGNRQGQRLFRTHINKPRRSGGRSLYRSMLLWPGVEHRRPKHVRGPALCTRGRLLGQSPPSPSAPWPGAASPSTTQHLRPLCPGVLTHAEHIAEHIGRNFSELFSKQASDPLSADNPSGTPVPTGCRRELHGTIEVHRGPHGYRRTTRRTCQFM